MKNLTSLIDIDGDLIGDLISHALKIKKSPEQYSASMKGKTMLMIFEKPSLRTRVSFQVGMHQLGGHTIVLETKDTPFREKESIADTAKASSKYVDIIMARLFKHEDIEELASNATVPVINGLTDTFHPCQILSDLLTIYEKKRKFSGLKLSFVGDGNNNITHDLLLGCSAAGIDISVGCPAEAEPQKWITEIANEKAKLSNSKIQITHDAREAVENADIVYADTWMSYHIPKDEKVKRVKMFQPYQVNKELMSLAKDSSIFMNCLPAMRGYEQTAEIIDGPQSVVFDQAENRLHMQKAIILKLMNKF
ncbi:MAG TPA: ornithine carbamoyltransferase [Candidatus Nanoarchaeia archaeon]|nr:ornithine carbamoyltransferase [Candidatus Nanoarchaeia archaeon]